MTDTSIDEALLPCPFCGGPVTLTQSKTLGDRLFVIECEQSSPCYGSGLGNYVIASQRETAIAAWNRRARDWQPISTAPRDGTQMLLWSAMWDMSWGIVLGHFEGDGEGGGEWVTSEGVSDDNEPGYDPNAEVDIAELFDPDDDSNMGPTHWMPMPKPPRALKPEVDTRCSSARR